MSTTLDLTRDAIASVDSARQIDDILGLPDQLRDALWRVESANLEPFDAPGGLVVATMLNPRSPYRLFEWCVFWPARRLLGGIERVFGVPATRRHGARRTGIVALGLRRFRHFMWRAGFQPEDALFYDVTPLVPPVDRVVRRWARGWREHPEKTVTRRTGKRWLGTGFLIAARRVADPV